MKPLLHISHPISEDTRSWINQPLGGAHVDANNWLDCTALIRDFNQNNLSEFCWRVCEWISVDLMFDAYKIL